MNPDGTTDRNAVSICGERPIGTRQYETIDGSGGSDALKVTDSADGHIRVEHIIGGREDCVDINNHAAHVLVECPLLEPRGDYVATIKGGSDDIVLRGTVRGHGKIVDVDIGNISDQSDDITRCVALHLIHEAGDPITIRILGAENPILLNSSTQKYVITFAIPKPFRGLFLKFYKQLKKVLPI